MSHSFAFADANFALEEPLALVADRDVDLSLAAGAQGAEHEAARVEVEARPQSLYLAAGQTAEEVLQCDVGVGLGLSFLGRAHEVHAADAGEVTAEVALAQQVAGVFPIRLTAFDEIVLGAATPARWEDEFQRQLRRRQGGQRGGLIQHDAVEPAVNRVAGIGPLTSRTDELRHGLASVQPRRARGVSPVILYQVGASMRNQGAYAPRSPRRAANRTLPSGPRLETKEDVAELNPVAVMQAALAGHRLVVDARPFGRRILVHQHITVAFTANDGMMLLDLHVAEQGDVGVFVAAEEIVDLFQRIFAAFLPAAHHLDRGGLEDALHQGRQRADAGAEDDEADRAP